ncbi:molybdopterin-guanine dinucleotide biosynthesis protein B [Polynucleobacter sp. AM-26B4]|uniref:molybdopterin-guanine dinucleotide biosynthesis protein B n=1 Tax=Polynucleobacter sp. AM-26B4 TaxID=2689103 RepID=UPI001C0E62A0|nr:molybdopterin-guanine dinucleotide biosynthesis protein B [Polynucleobacter sp. AM-26B4]MBU3584749.1 molybdopterin-guanine dinucleotide biosynthesis protein B [Polynucleobacter sp. AM-26B4]
MSQIQSQQNTSVKANPVPVVGFVAYSGTGKTTLIEKLIAFLTERAYKVSVIKHTHHHFDIDKPGKDSYRHREAGASEVLMVSDQRWVLMHELRQSAEPTMEEQLSKLSPCDLVIVEGFKDAKIPKIELWRHEHDECVANSVKANQDNFIQAIAYPGGIDAINKPDLTRDIPVLDLNNIEEVAQQVLSIAGVLAK